MPELARYKPFSFADPANPQSWNLYSYGSNSPLVYSDPDGHEPDPCGGNPNCVTVVAQQERLTFFEEMLYRMFFSTAQFGQQVQQVTQPMMDRMAGPHDPMCTANYTGVGSTIGFWAGGGVGSLGLAGGPVAGATIPVGALGGAAGGAVVGGALGGVLCSTGRWGGSGGGKGGEYRDKTRGANANDQKQISAAAREVGVDGRAFGRYVEKTKNLEGRRASDNFSFEELLQLAREFKNGNR